VLTSILSKDSASSKLTIAIPTFNHAALLQKNLKTIADRLPSWIHLLIVDNASDPVVQFDTDLRSTLDRQGVTYTIVSNCTNIGGGANILRCFENVDTDWLFLCGDDDHIDPERLEEVWAISRTYPEASFVKFSSRFHQYATTIQDTGVCAFMEVSGDFNNLLFMSTYMFNRQLCLPYLRFGYLMNAAYAPHVEVAILAASEHPFVLSPVYVTHANNEDAAWSPVDVVLSAYHLSDSPLTAKERNAVVCKIYSAHNIGRELMDIVTIFNTPGMKDEARFLRRKAIHTHLFFGNGLKRLLALAVLLIIPVFGSTGKRFLANLYRNASGREYTRKFVSRHEGL
jgi:glycosyltransferase involved in cell wall biosynthesis